MCSRRWKKVLYEKQGVPDNYVPPSFLGELRKNVNLKSYSWTEVVLAASCVSQEISWTFLFFVVFAYLDSQLLCPLTLLFGVGTVTFLLYLIYVLDTGYSSLSTLVNKGLEDLKSVVVFLAFGYGLSPILKTLTESISTDTIYAMVTIMMIAHVAFQDYGADAAIVSSTLSLNAAIFAAVCLASRLPSTSHAFSLLTTATGVFVLAPIFRRHVQESSRKGQAVMTVVLVLIAITATASLSLINSVLFSLIVFFVNAVCPALFLYCQVYKENIYGPWDEAIIIQG